MNMHMTPNNTDMDGYGGGGGGGYGYGLDTRMDTELAVKLNTSVMDAEVGLSDSDTAYEADYSELWDDINLHVVGMCMQYVYVYV